MEIKNWIINVMKMIKIKTMIYLDKFLGIFLIKNCKKKIKMNKIFQIKKMDLNNKYYSVF